jgi:cell division septum initiation protein DivIVA
LRFDAEDGIFLHRSVVREDLMGGFEPEVETGQRGADEPPGFRLVRRGYDREQVDAYVPQLISRLEEAVDRLAKAERARSELQREVATLRGQAPPTFEQLGNEAATVLEEAGRSAELLVEKARRRADTIVDEAKVQAEQVRADVTEEAKTALAAASDAAERIRQQVQQERATLDSETQQVREFRDALLDDLGRVHVDIGALLERTRRHRDQTEQASQAAPDGDGNGKHAAPEPSPEPARAAESK